MKKTVGILLLFVWLFGLSVPVKAAQTDEHPGYEESVLQELYEESGLQEAAGQLDRQTAGLLESLGISPKEGAALIDADLSRLPALILELIREGWRKPLGQLSALLALLLLALILKSSGEGMGNEAGIRLFLLFAAAGVLGQPLILLFGQIGAAFDTAGGFLESFIPAYAGLMAASGQGASACGLQTMAFGSAAVVVQLMEEVLLPVLSVYLVFCLICPAGGLLRMDAITGAVSQAAGWVLGTVMALFTAVLGLQKGIAQAADSLGLRTAKLALSTLVPVVGSSLSEALSSVLSGMHLVKTSAGSLAVLVLLLLFLPSLISLTELLLVVKLSQLGAGLLGVEAGSSLFGALSAGLGLLTGIVLCGAAALLIGAALLASASQRG